jgi:hypothetical protein
MNSRVEVVRADGDLKRSVWKFSIWDLPRVHLDWYSEEMRATRRHKFRSVRSYSRLDTNSYALRAAPPVPEGVLEDMRQQVLDMAQGSPYSRRSSMVPVFTGETSA